MGEMNSSPSCVQLVSTNYAESLKLSAVFHAEKNSKWRPRRLAWRGVSRQPVRQMIATYQRSLALLRSVRCRQITAEMSSTMRQWLGRNTFFIEYTNFRHCLKGNYEL